MELPVRIRALVWDDWNVAHLRERHQITREEVESVLQSALSVAQETYKQRLLVVGPSNSGGILAVVIGPVPEMEGVFYTFSARPASRKERRYFELFHEDSRHE